MVDGQVVRKLLQLLGIFRQVIDLLLQKLLQVYKPGSRGAENSRQLWWAVHDHVLIHLRVLEADEDWERCVHGYHDRSSEVRRINCMNRLAKAEGANDVHTQTAKGVVQVCSLRSLALPREDCAQRFGLLSDQVLGTIDSSLRERAVEHIFAYLSCEQLVRLDGRMA